MTLTKLLVLGAILGIATLALPADLGVAGTASANTCTPYLVDGDVKGYQRCAEQQCQWNEFPYGAPVCTD